MRLPLRSIALLLVCGLVQQTIAAPYRSPMAQHPAPPQQQTPFSEAEIQAEREEQQELKEQAFEMLRAAPISFEKNEGQFPGQVRFAAQGVGSGAYLSAASMTLAVPLPPEEPADPEIPDKPEAAGAKPIVAGHVAVRMTLDGADDGAQAVPLEPTKRRSNYYRGRNNMIQDVEHFSRLRFASVYPGTDVVYYGADGALEYDFVLEPGADAAPISLRFDGVDRIRFSSAGDLLLSTAAGVLRQSRPIAYQKIDGERVAVAADFERRDAWTVGFRIGEYDRNLPLVIDPKIYYATGLGGPGDDIAGKVKVDDDDNIFISGTTTNPAWSVLSSAAAEENPEQTSAPTYGFVLRLDRVTTESGPDIYELASAAFLGDGVLDTAIEDIDYHDGAIYATGFGSGDLPTTDPIVQQNNSARRAFLFVLGAVGLSIILLRLYGIDSHGFGIRVIVPAVGAVPIIAMAILFFGATFLGQPKGQGQYGAALITVALTGILLAILGFYQAVAGAILGITALIWTIFNGVVHIGIVGAADNPIMGAEGTLGGGWGGFFAVYTMTVLGILAPLLLYMFGGLGSEFISGAFFVVVGGVLAIMLSVISTSRTLFGIENRAPVNAFNLFLGIIAIPTLALLAAWAVLGLGNIFGAGLATDRWNNAYVCLQMESVIRGAEFVSAAGAVLAVFTDLGSGLFRAGLFNVGVLKFGLNLAAIATVILYYAVVVRSTADMRARFIWRENWENPIIIGTVAANGFTTTAGAVQTTIAGGIDSFLLLLKEPLILAQGILNGASFKGGSLTPCSIVSVFGHWIGPKQLAVFALQNGLFPTVLGGTRLLINGTPQSLIFTFKEQLSAVVFCELGLLAAQSKAQSGRATISVDFDGQSSNQVLLPITPTDPALFTVSQTGVGKTATLNQDFSINTAANPAPVGTTVSLFGTGGGITDPFCDSSGLSSATELMPTVASFAATVGGQPATMVFSGAAPASTCGLNQWNVTVPQGLTAADANQDPDATTICVQLASGEVIEAAVEVIAQ